MKALLHPSAHADRTRCSLGSRAYEGATSVSRSLQHGFNTGKARHPRAEDQEVLMSAEMAAEVTKHFENLAEVVSWPASTGGKFRCLPAKDQEALTSAETAAEVYKHFHSLAQAMNRPAPSGGKFQRLRIAEDLKALTSAETAAQVRKHFESLARAVSPPASGENTELKTSVNCTDAARGGVLSIPPRLYREYADDLKKLAKTATNEHQRVLYLKMANIWKFAAIRFEAGLETT